jgi:hypothetical protein
MTVKQRMVGVLSAMAVGAALVVAFGGSPVEAAQVCGGQNRVEVVPPGGSFSCEATQPLPRDNRHTGQSSDPQFTAFALVTSDGATVTVSASGAPDGWTLFVASQRGISGGFLEGQDSATFSGGAATVTVVLQCGQVDVNALPPGFSGERGVWRIAGPYITNSSDCATQQPTTTAATTTGPTMPTTAPSTGPTTPTTAPSTGPTTPTTAPSTGPTTPSSPTTAPASVSQSSVRPGTIPTTGGGNGPLVLVAMVALAAGVAIVAAVRRRATMAPSGE